MPSFLDLANQLEAQETPETGSSATSTWRENWECARLESTYRRCDAEWPAGARVWLEDHRPKLQRAIVAATERIDDAFRARDVAAHVEACRALRLSTRRAAAAFRAAHDLPDHADPSPLAPGGDRLEIGDDGAVYRVDSFTGDRIAVDADGLDVGTTP